MIEVNNEKKIVEVSNNTLLAEFSYENGVILRHLTNAYSKIKANTDKELFMINIFGKDIYGSQFTCKDVKIAKDEVIEMVSFQLDFKEFIKFRLHIINYPDGTTRILYQCSDSYKAGVPSVIFFNIPFLGELISGGGHDLKYYPMNSVRDKDGNDVLHRVNESFYNSDIIMPLVVCDEKTGCGFEIEFPVSSDLSDLGSVQNINYQLSRISSENELKNHRVRLNPDVSYNDTAELLIMGIKDGWAEAFDHRRETWKENYDFYQYEREDLKWFRNCAVHNFTFLYGKEGFDHENQRIDVEKLVKEGEEFGGFDTVILWNQYPRLGVDERTQWNFYDDFPGGRKAIREAVDKFHEKGIKVLLPFIPWDRHEDEGTDSMGTELARLAKDTDLDGFHLDTMKTFAQSAREKLDKIKPGIVLETQGHPMKKRSMELVTASWDEFWSADPMPEVDVLRFIHPKHVAPVIGRWLRLEDKDTLIKRAEFGGASIVIWQDIFGRWMPWNEGQKKRIALWKKTYLKYLDVYLGEKPIPLYYTGADNVFCNVFVSDTNDAQIYSFYNDNAQNIKIEDLSLWRFNSDKAEVVLGQSDVEIIDNKISLVVPAKEIVHVLVKH